MLTENRVSYIKPIQKSLGENNKGLKGGYGPLWLSVIACVFASVCLLHLNTHARTLTHTLTHTRTNTCLHAHAYTCTYLRTRAHTHAQLIICLSHIW